MSVTHPVTRSTGHIDFTEHTLANGLRVLLHVDNGAAVVCVNIAYHVGSKNESISRRGFAHLFEHLLFEGSKHVPRGAFDDYITKAGGYDNAYTTEDKTNYFEVLPSNELNLALWLESDRLREFAISEISLTTQKSVVKEEKRERYDNTPYGSMTIRMNRLAYKNFPYWWSVIGDMETIDAATLDDVRDFFQTYYVPENATLVISGNIDPTAVLRDVEAYFGDIAIGAKAKLRPDYDEPEATEERRVVVSDEPVPLPAVFQAYKIPAEASREFIAIDLLTEILATGRSSRMYRSLIYEKQIASEANAFVDAHEMPGLCYLYAVASEPTCVTSELEAAMNAVLEEVRTGGVTDDELQKAKNKTEARLVSSRLTASGKADQLAHAAVILRDPHRVNTILEEYQSITAAEVAAAVRTYFVPQNRSTVIYELAEQTETVEL